MDKFDRYLVKMAGSIGVVTLLLLQGTGEVAEVLRAILFAVFLILLVVLLIRIAKSNKTKNDS